MSLGSVPGFGGMHIIQGSSHIKLLLLLIINSIALANTKSILALILLVSCLQVLAVTDALKYHMQEPGEMTQQKLDVRGRI